MTRPIRFSSKYWGSSLQQLEELPRSQYFQARNYNHTRLQSKSFSSKQIFPALGSLFFHNGSTKIHHRSKNFFDAKVNRYELTRVCPRLTSIRFFSSRRDRSRTKGFDLRALPFSISPEEALYSFHDWAENDQGLKYLLDSKSIRIGAAFVPVWTFDLNIRFKQQETKRGFGLYSWKPSIFDGYDQGGSSENVIHLPGGLSAYAGYSYRRSLINPVHSTTLIFMGDQTQPFGGWMLKDMILRDNGYPVHVIPDAWNSTQGRAFSVVKEELQGIVNDDWVANHEDDATRSSDSAPIAQTQVVSSRRVMMPTFVIEYKIFGLEYQAFVSGCDKSAPVGGVSHQIFEHGNGASFDNSGGLSPEFVRSSRNLLVQLSSGASYLLRTVNLPVLLTIFRPLFSFVWFLLIRIGTAVPVIGVLGGFFAGFRKVIQPWMDNRKASAEWERQRQHEAEMNDHKGKDHQFYHAKMNDFDDVTGRARAHFQKYRESILHSLSGDANHQEGSYDWYAEWQAWAQQQWEQQAKQQQYRQQQYYNSQEQQQRYQQTSQQRTKTTKSKDEFKWPFDPKDPYSVLGIDQSATDAEVSDAFRKEMLKYHPDTKPNATEAQKRRSVERSKLITEAYRIIKTERKAKK